MQNKNFKNEYTIEEAWRYLANAKETLLKSPIEYGRYSDSKYVREAAGIGYLAALKALDVYIVTKGMDKTKLPKSIEEYFDFIRKHIPLNGKLYAAMNTAYENLHILAYYRGGTAILMVKEGFENVKKIIELMSLLMNKRGANLFPGRVNEDPVPYRKMKTGKRKK